ncbi:MAG: hypothetical protein ABI847_09480 [Anaerolineales bacterium]
MITSPLEGAILSGLVPVTGTATHPEFQRYELSFAYSPNPTDTWFPLQPPAVTQVVNEIIGRWDTTLISDGVYTLRLRVFFSDTAYLEAFVPNIRVQNSAPTQPAPVATPGSPTPPGVDITLPATPTPTAPGIDLPPTATAQATASSGQTGGPSGPPAAGGAIRINGALIGTAFLAGVRLTLISFVILGAYAALRAVLRMRPRPRR